MADKDKAKRSMHLATVGIGSNLGNKEATIQRAIQRLHECNGNRVRKVSSLFETEPVGKLDQPWFLNCVAQVETSLEMKSFFSFLKEVETLFERVRKERWGPRTLDLDLLMFDDVIYSDSALTVPHPDMQKRRFVLEPLCEIAPDLVHPGLNLSTSNLLKVLEDSSRVVSLNKVPWKGNIKL